MELEIKFYKWYKKISLDTTNEQTESRWKGVQNVVERFQSLNEISDLIRLYFRLECNPQSKKEFIDCFFEIDKGFDENNEEEIVILAGSSLAQMLDVEEDVFVALSLLVLEPYNDVSIKELSDMANETVIDLGLQIRKDKPSAKKQLATIKPDSIKNLVAEDDTFSDGAPKVLISIIETLKNNINFLNEKNKSLLEENIKYKEEIQILSWIVGEWSNILKLPLEKVNNTNGVFVLGAELSDLVKLYPGPYASEAFLHKMLNKCINIKEKLTLTELIDLQEVNVREILKDKYGNNTGNINLPIISAVIKSLEVENPREWIPIYKKSWKIEPDNIELDLLSWALLIYQECMISCYIVERN